MVVESECTQELESPHFARGVDHVAPMGKRPWSALWLLSSDMRKISGTLITPMATPIWPWWANDNDVAHLEAKTVPMNLTWSESAQWLLRSSVRKAPGVFITPVWLWWANDHDVAHLQIKTVPMNFIWSESAQWLPSSSVPKVSRVIIKPMWPSGHITMALHIYRSRQFQRTLFGVNWPSDCGVTVSTRSGRTDWRTDGDYFIAPLTFVRKGGGQ